MTIPSIETTQLKERPTPWQPLDYNSQAKLLDRTVTWYNKTSKSDNPHVRRAAAITMVAAAIFLALLVVTIPLIIKFTAKLHHIREVEKFYEEAENITPPKIPGHIEVETKTQTFNHVSNYVIHDGVIWHKQRYDGRGEKITDSTWQPLYFDGWPKRTPVEIKADGANLIVIDDEKGVHYKKVIKEKLENVERFFEMNAEAKPPSIDHVDTTTKKGLSNKEYSFAIHQNKVWFKPKKDDGKWQLMYVPLNHNYNGKQQLNPKELQLDDDKKTLIVIDDKGGKHRIAEEHFTRKSNYYSVHDKSNKDNWKDEWYTFPVLHNLVNIFTGKRLYLPEKTKDWAIGHRGQYNQYIQDREDNPHRVGTGVTTLYILDESGKYIYLYDPWKPKSLKVRIPIPGTAESPFIAESINVAASKVMLMGYRYEKSDNGKYKKIPAIQTMIVDVDSLGWNPTLKYSYSSDDNKSNPNVRIMPTAKDGWESHQLPDGEFSSNGTILQTGKGNRSREMRVVGKKDNKKGYWHKLLDDKTWEFQPFSIQEEGYKRMTVETVDESKVQKPIVHNWNHEGDFNAELMDFNNEIVNQEIIIDGATLLLHRKDNIIVQTITGGKKLYHYDLVLPEGVEAPESLRKHFRGKRVLPVTVKTLDSDTTLHIKGRGISRLKIRMVR